MDTAEFIKKARSAHGDRYEYNKSVYHYRNPVIITCKIHGDFSQRYDHHVGPRRSGCSQCYFDSLCAEQDKIIKKMTLIHGGKYDYEKVKYIRATKKVIITCRIHGDFTQTPAGHFVGFGCPACSKTNTRTTRDEFIKKANSLHNNKYDYSLSEYTGSGSWLKIICPIHGVFEKTPDNHCHKTRPQGCQICHQHRGFRNNAVGYVYLMKSVDNKFMKIGITNNTRQRYKRLQKLTPFEFLMIGFKKFTVGSDARSVEKKMHSIFKSANLSGFDGCTEWFEWDESALSKIYM